MRFTFLCTAITLASFFLIPTEYRKGAEDVVGEIIASFQSNTEGNRAAEVAVTIKPGQRIYDLNGQNIGAIVALTTRDGEITRIWTNNAEFGVGEVDIKTGRLVLSGSKQVSSDVSKTLHALP